MSHKTNKVIDANRRLFLTRLLEESGGMFRKPCHDAKTVGMRAYNIAYRIFEDPRFSELPETVSNALNLKSLSIQALKRYDVGTLADVADMLAAQWNIPLEKGAARE